VRQQPVHGHILLEARRPAIIVDVYQTLIAQTGVDEARRSDFMNQAHMRAIAALQHEWQAKLVKEALF
jgi:hypothetical protein